MRLRIVVVLAWLYPVAQPIAANRLAVVMPDEACLSAAHKTSPVSAPDDAATIDESTSAQVHGGAAHFAAAVFFSARLPLADCSPAMPIPAPLSPSCAASKSSLSTTSSPSTAATNFAY
jgi:hypothetical protein